MENRTGRIHDARTGIAAALLILLSLTGGVAAAQAAVNISVVLEEEQVYLGESFFFQLRVVGGQKVEKPDMSAFGDFDVREIPDSWLRYRQGGSWDRFKLGEGTGFLYRLVALRPGSVRIPSAAVEVDGRSYRSPAATLEVTLPPPSEDFKLFVSLNRREVFVGEPFELNAVWYYREAGRYYYANIPILRHPSFASGSSGSSGGSAGLVRAVGPTGSLSGNPGTALLNGISYSTLTFTEVITPTQAGSFEFHPSTVQIWVPRDESESSGSRRGWNFDSTVVGSSALSLRVLPLPAAGRPADFSGIVSERLEVQTELTPEVMNVGDPVTLRVSLSGPPSLTGAELPSLAALEAVSESFALGRDAPAEELRDGEKIFRQTVRVRHEDVQEFPAIEVSYFNTRSRRYETAASRPFPITVRPTRIVTADDLVGQELDDRVEVRSYEEGILHNYQASSRLLRDAPLGVGTVLRRPGVSALLGASLLILAAALVVSRRRSLAAERLAAQSAATVRRATPPLQRLQDRLAEAGKGTEPGGAGRDSDPQGSPGRLEATLAAWREYLRGRLGLPAGRVSRTEVEAELERRAADPGLRRRVAELLQRQELLRYRGDARPDQGEASALEAEILALARELEERAEQP